MELRDRHPADTTPAETARTADLREPQDGAARGARSRPADVGPARTESPRYDADAEFKRGVPRPAGYSPDDTGGLSPPETADTAQHPEVHHDDRRPHETPRLGEAREHDEADPPHAMVDHPPTRDPFDDNPPDRYGDPLTGQDGARVPLFEGPPSREQTRQGWAGDCGLIAALGAVAAHRPVDIAGRVREKPDGDYRVTLSEARQTSTGAIPTGRNIELTVTPELPVRDERPGTPACAKAEQGTAWCPVMEKAFAGVDRAWTDERRAVWRDDWAYRCKEDQRVGRRDPRSGPAPAGYVRLHQGSTAWDQAEMLTQLTGQAAEVREFPAGREEWRINRIIRAQLTEGKPVLAGSRAEAHTGEQLPHRLEASHVYEVTGVEKGKIVLRNPWNYKHPEPMETKEFARNMSSYYSTLA